MAINEKNGSGIGEMRERREIGELVRKKMKRRIK